MWIVIERKVRRANHSDTLRCVVSKNSPTIVLADAHHHGALHSIWENFELAVAPSGHLEDYLHNPNYEPVYDGDELRIIFKED